MNTQHIAAVTVLLAAAVVPVADADTIYVDADADCSSDCCFEHDTPGCDGPPCEALVCGLVPDCCNVEWDPKCVAVAAFLCDPLCQGGDGTEAFPFCSIQDAINASIYRDEVVVAPGTYFEAINFLGKAIWLRSSGGRDVTIIDGTGFFHVVQCVSGEGSDTVLDGFTITGGSGSTKGGGMLNDNSSNPMVTNCTFSGNSADIGGGGMFNGGSSPMVTNCSFDRNTAAFNGGGMRNEGGSPTVIDCSFTNNSAGNGPGTAGGGMSIGGGTVTNCVFDTNTAGGTGGGMFCYGSADVTNCVFSANTALDGGGMFSSGFADVVTNCVFRWNSAESGGGMTTVFVGATITGCLFEANVAEFGGGMRNSDSNPTVTNCTFVANEGAAIANTSQCSFQFCGSFPQLRNCVLSGNTPVQIFDSGQSESGLQYSNIQGGWLGTGNIDADPLFVDPANGDYRLSSGSPCIDAGNNNAVAGLADTDLDGNPRFADDLDTEDTGCGVPVVVDIGAYEYQGVPAEVEFADLNIDGFVGVADLMILNGCISSSDPDCCIADLDLDGVVGMSDRILMWGELIEFLPVR